MVAKRKRGIAINIRDNQGTLLYVFHSKQALYDIMHMHHKSLSVCLNFKTPYLNYFYFDTDVHTQAPRIANEQLFTTRVTQKRALFQHRYKRAIKIKAENVLFPKRSKTFFGLRALARQLNASRGTVRACLKASRLYKKTWCFHTL